MELKKLENIKHVLEFKEARKNTQKIQEKLLLKIIKKNEKTLYGIKNKFKEIKNTKDYQKKVPIINYEDITKYIELLKKGQQNILTKDKVIYFATTSGTTKTTKLIPITKQRTKTFKQELSLWSFKFLRENPTILKGKLLYFAGPYDEGKTEAGIMKGSISGYLAHKTSWLVKQKLAVPPKLYNELNYDKKIKKIAKLAIKNNVTQLGFAFPTEVLMFLEYLKKNKQELIKEIKKEGHWIKAKILEKKEFTPKKLWPNLKIVNCIKSDANQEHIKKLQKKLPGVLINDPGIYSSEGRISLCLKPGAESGIPPITINFFEFEDIETKEIKLAHELKENKKYEVIITTQEGLYRYRMGDIIKVTGHKDNTPLIKFYDRTNYLNIAGELAHEKILIETMNETLKETKIKLRAYTYTPHITKTKPRYHIIIEPTTKITKEQSKELLKKIEQNLQNNINDYKQMRNEFGRINPPILSILKKGSYDAYDKKRMTRGGQQKPIIIHKDPNFIKNFEIEQQIKS